MATFDAPIGTNTAFHPHLAGRLPSDRPRRAEAPTAHHPGGRVDVMVVYGTRPEAVKMAPVVRALHASPLLDPVVLVTGQHREMLDQVHEVFGIVPDHDLDIHRTGQSLPSVTVDVVAGVTRVLQQTSPAAVLVQGDTTTTVSAALAAFYAGVPVVHLEAGLRTGDPRAPFPEEVNRRLTTQVASVHLAPTHRCRANLLRENVDPRTVHVTGNTVVDAIGWALRHGVGADAPLLRQVADHHRRVVLVTAHRRESWGAPLVRIARAVAEIARRNDDVVVVLPVHANPRVRAVLDAELGGVPNVVLTGPVAYGTFVHLLARAHLVLSDSGGVQEEAPTTRTPVLVLRSTTERVEALTAGTARLVGTRTARIVAEAQHLLDDDAAHARMADAVNPFGDGTAAERTVAALAHHVGLGPRPVDLGSPQEDDELVALAGPSGL